MPLPTFQTTRLLIVPRSMADFRPCLEMDRDPEVTKYVPGPWSEPERHEAFLRERIAKDYGPGFGYWCVRRIDRPIELLGWLFLLPSDGASDAEIGWRFRRGAWGNGYATEAARMLVKHAFCQLGLKRVKAEIHPDNEGSIRVAMKIGMRRSGVVDEEGVEFLADHALILKPDHLMWSGQLFTPMPNTHRDA